MSLFERVIVKVSPTTHGCWLWTAFKDHNGYGRINIDNHPRLAHRVLYELTVGPIPVGLDLDHTCRNPGCVRPSHMEPVTHAENMRRSRKTECINGHQYDEANTYINPFSGRRECRGCNRERQRKNYPRRKAA